MIESFILWLGGLPPVAIYATIALLAMVENVFPPFPADTAIAMGGFLAHRGVTDPMTVFVVTFIANVGGAMGMYFLAARHADKLFQTRLAGWLLSEKGIEFIQTEYRRFGLPGLFVARLLPGFRAVVAPFAGLVHLGPLKAALPIACASALWYGTIIFGAAMLGDRFDQVLDTLGGVNRSLGIVALVIAVVGAFWLVRRRRNKRADSEL